MTFTDNELISRLIRHLNMSLSTYPFVGLSDPIIVQQKQQPTQQGIPAGPTVYVERLFDHRYGSPIIVYDAAPASNDLRERESQVYETTFQISTMLRSQPTMPGAPTAPDLCNIVCGMVQSRAIIRLLSADGIGLLRVSNVRNVYFANDENVQESNPSFDLVMTYERTNSVLPIPVLHPPEMGIYPI